MARFWGKLMLLSFAVGVVTGIVQEFQFGMNWSEYSRYVGDVFGAPLAMEGLAAFFLESTFIGLWIFGRDRLLARVHLATIWAVAIGTALSAYFILAANSWMQHPVGYRIGESGPRRDDEHLGGADQLDGPLRLRRTRSSAPLATAGMVMLGSRPTSSLRRRDVDGFRRSATARPGGDLRRDRRHGHGRPLPGAADDRRSSR